MSDNTTTRPDDTSCAYTYTVKRGDSFYLIARRLGVPLRDLMNANPDIHPARLMVGDELCIPSCAEREAQEPAPLPDSFPVPDAPDAGNQPAPLPETMIGGDARAYLHAKLGGWGSAGLAHIEPPALAEYERCFCTPEAIHAACEDYRASAGIDLEHDRESRARGEKIACDTLAICGANGVVHRLFDPLALWQAQCAGWVSGQAVPAGHFIPEELPSETAQALRSFMC